MSRVLKKMRTIRSWYNYVWNDKSPYKINFFTKVKYTLKGFSVNEYVWYNLKTNDYKNYISDYERIKSRDINGEYKIILDNKLLFEEVFRNYTKVPKTYAWISNGYIYGIHDNIVDENGIIKFIAKIGKAVLKLERGFEGKGIYVVEYISEDTYIINGKKSTINDLNKILKNIETAVLTEYIEQSDFEKNLYANSTNTLRIVCAKKKNEKKVKIIKAFQRIGSDCSAPVDNISAGGYASEINLDTGELGKIITKAGKMENRLIPYSVHPDNGSQIEGKIIPNWNIIKKEITDLTNQFPYLNFVAWDVLLTNDGFCIIEGNASSGCGLFQLEHGIKNEEYGDILRSYGVFK